MRKISIYLLGFLFFLSCRDLCSLTFHQSQDTLNTIIEIIKKEEPGIYLRFGDGDVVLAHGQNDSYQKNTKKLQEEMKEAFSLNGKNVLKCLPLGCAEFNGFEKGMFPGNHASSYEGCINMVRLASKFWNGEMEDVYSMTALSHLAVSNLEACVRFLKLLKGSNCALFIGNKEIPEEVVRLLFGDRCQIVPTPPKNSYDQIDQIEESSLRILKNCEGYKIVITSMGCSGRILQKRLWSKVDNVFLFDFGSLMDAICGWQTRAWIELTDFDAELFMKTLKEGLN